MGILNGLHGLRQSPIDWRDTIDKHMIGVGLKGLKLDPCVYTYSEASTIVIYNVYVDDVSPFRKYVRVLRRIMRKLLNRFSLAVMEHVSLLLVMGVAHDPREWTAIITLNTCTKSLLGP